MNKEVLDLWLTALRSGEYKQCYGRLRIGDTYCVLGVLCDVHQKNTGEGEWYFSPSAYFVPKYNYRSQDGCFESTSFLIKPVLEWAELNFEDYAGPCIPEDSDNSLSIHSDSPKSFTELADLLEERFK